MSGCLCLRLPGCCGTHGPPPLFFLNADAWSGVGGAVPPFDLPTTPVETTTAPASLLDVCQRINGGNGATRHAAATHSFDDTQRPTLAFFSIGTDHNLPTTPPRVPAVSQHLGGRSIRTALCVNFRQGFTAFHARHGTTARTRPDIDTPPPIASTETMRQPQYPHLIHRQSLH